MARRSFPRLRPAVRELLWRAALAAASAALLTLAWASLEEPFGPRDTAMWLLALALAPAALSLALRRIWIGLVAFVLALLPAASLAFDVPLTALAPGGRGFVGPLGAAIGDGFRDLYDTDAPFGFADHPELAAVVLCGLFVSVAVSTLAIVAGRALLAAAVLAVGVGLPVTVAASYGIGDPLRTGSLLLGVVLLLLAATRRRRPLPGAGAAVALGAIVALVAVSASTSNAVGREGLVAWERWDLYDAPAEPVGVSYVWNSSYGGISFPDRETVVLRIRAPNRSLYWRATTLDEYTGLGWREALRAVPAVGRQTRSLEAFLPDEAFAQRRLVRQDVTVVALRDVHLVAAPQPVRWSAGAQRPLRSADNGTLVAPRGLSKDAVYSVWSYAPEVKPRELAALPPDYPAEIERYLELVPGLPLPAFGTSERDGLVEQLFGTAADVPLLAAYAPLYREARRVAGDAASPYLAAAALEAYFRGSGGFRYEEQPAQPLDGTPPLVDFVLRTREGYCQHFAGAMAVMLRLLGVPARVAVGFTSGSYDERRGEWVVTDHNAHAWVEVYFPDYGWLSFDPTPGRGSLAASYSTASAAFPAGDPEALGTDSTALPEALRERLGVTDEASQGTRAGSAASTDAGGGLGAPLLALVALAGAIALFVAGKLGRRLLVRLLAREPRTVASACRRHLAAFLADQGLRIGETTTLDELGRCLARAYRVDAAPFVRAVEAARFGPPGAETAASAARARAELAVLLGQLRRRLTPMQRARGLLSVRSLRA